MPSTEGSAQPPTTLEVSSPIPASPPSASSRSPRTTRVRAQLVSLGCGHRRATKRSGLKPSSRRPAPSHRPSGSGSVAQLRCCSAHRCAGSIEPTRRRRACAEPRARRSLIAPPTSSTRADRAVVRRLRRPGRTAGRRPTSSSRSASLMLCPSPRRLTRANTTTASVRRAASTSFLDRAADLADARRLRRRATRAPSRPHRRAPTDAILTLSFVDALPIAAPAHSSQHDDGERAHSREHVVP